MIFLRVSGITKREGTTPVLQGIDFTQKKSSKMAIVGETGSGKSTLLKVIAGLAQPDTGEVLFEHKKVQGPADKLIPGHPGIAYLSQHFELRNNYRVEEILSYANELGETAAATLYGLCRISHLLKRRTDQLSGGEKQRIALARLLVSSPRLLLLDEPFSNLDLIHRDILKAVVHDLGEKLKMTCLLVSHEPFDILPWADELLIMKDGQILQKGSPEAVYHQPVNAYAGALLGSCNIIEPARAAAFYALPGIKNNGKSLFIRPEHFSIGKQGKHSLAGKVGKISFAGGSHEVAVALAEITVTVKANPGRLVKGDTVYLSLATAGVWYI